MKNAPIIQTVGLLASTLFTILLICAISTYANTQPSWNQLQDTTIRVKDSVFIDAQYPGGSKAWTMYLLKNLRYPPVAFANRIQGTVILNFNIDEKGRVKDIKATGGEEGGLRQEAVRLLKEGGKWTPATLNDKPVETAKVQNITFRF